MFLSYGAQRKKLIWLGKAVLYGYNKEQFELKDKRDRKKGKKEKGREKEEGRKGKEP